MEEITKFYSLIPPGLMTGPQQTSNNNNNHSHTNSQSDMALAMAYVKLQNWQQIYPNDKAIIRGTIFEQLDKPFKGAKR